MPTESTPSKVQNIGTLKLRLCCPVKFISFLFLEVEWHDLWIRQTFHLEAGCQRVHVQSWKAHLLAVSSARNGVSRELVKFPSIYSRYPQSSSKMQIQPIATPTSPASGHRNYLLALGFPWSPESPLAQPCASPWSWGHPRGSLGSVHSHVVVQDVWIPQSFQQMKVKSRNEGRSPCICISQSTVLTGHLWMSLYLPGTVLFTKIPDFMSYLIDASLVHQVCQRLGDKTYIVIESITNYYRCKSATVLKRSEVTALRPSKLWNKKVCKLFLGSPWWGVPKYLHWNKKKPSRVLRPRHSKEFAPRNSSRRFSARLKGGFPVTPSIADNKPVGSIKGILGVGEDSHRLINRWREKSSSPKKMQAKLKVMPPHGTFTPSMSTTNLRG